MKKILLEGLIIVFLFFSTLIVLRQIDWTTLLKVEKVTEKTEEKLGTLFWEIFEKTERENKSHVVIHSIDSILNKICTENFIDRKSIKLHVLQKDEVNAFALPNGHLILFSGLILACENQEELSGVICHEIAHIELNHVMKKLINEVGLSVLVSMATGNNSSEIISETARMLSSTAFGRELEKEADLQAVDYLLKANIDPEPFANFLYKLSVNESEVIQYLSWISTHPASKDRAIYILNYTSNKILKKEIVLSAESWKNLKMRLKE
ncbi:MAG: M48 family metallopeptidase [Salinivirgaceae bacterium]|jgi:predicted Zn-dependent protease|nr:M48 family metallopeptidase [Salinivirgaceae bacterium]